jgi:Flp pilus assembly protein TadG
MIKATVRPAPRRATAAVEFALLSPVLLTLLLGVWEVGRLVQVQQIVDNAAREGARQAARGDLHSGTTNPQVETEVQNYLQNYKLSLTGVQITVTNVTQNKTDVFGANPLDQVDCTVKYPFNNVRWLAINLFVPNNSTLNASADWRNMAPQPLVINQSIPTVPN